MLETVGEFTPEEVLESAVWPVPKELKKVRKEFKLFSGEVLNIKVSSQRLAIFKNNPSCVCCGITGNTMLLQRHTPKDTPHFNFYYKDDNGLILLTKDHIKAKSKGGRDTISNYQTMCTICNGLKSDSNMSLNNLKILRKKYDKLEMGKVYEAARVKRKELERFKNKLLGEQNANRS